MRPAAFVLLALLLLLACNGESPTAPSPPQPPAPARVSGFVRYDDSGAPVAGAVLTFICVKTPFSVTTGADGSYSVDGVEPGKAGVTLSVPGENLRELGSIMLFSGDNRRDFLARGSSRCVRPYGEVRDARTGRPIAGAFVRLFRSSGTTDANGRWQFEMNCDGVAGSTTSFHVSHPQYVTHENLTRASFICTCAMDVALQPK